MIIFNIFNEFLKDIAQNFASKILTQLSPKKKEVKFKHQYICSLKR